MEFFPENYRFFFGSVDGTFSTELTVVGCVDSLAKLLEILRKSILSPFGWQTGFNFWGFWFRFLPSLNVSPFQFESIAVVNDLSFGINHCKESSTSLWRRPKSFWRIIFHFNELRIVLKIILSKQTFYSWPIFVAVRRGFPSNKTQKAVTFLK